MKRYIVIITTVCFCNFTSSVYAENEDPGGLKKMFNQIADTINKTKTGKRSDRATQNGLEDMFEQIKKTINDRHCHTVTPRKERIGSESHKPLMQANNRKKSVSYKNQVLRVNRKYGFIIVWDAGKMLNQGKEIVIMRGNKLVATGRVSSIGRKGLAVVNIKLMKNRIKTTDSWEVVR